MSASEAGASPDPGVRAGRDFVAELREAQAEVRAREDARIADIARRAARDEVARMAAGRTVTIRAPFSLLDPSVDGQHRLGTVEHDRHSWADDEHDALAAVVDLHRAGLVVVECLLDGLGDLYGRLVAVDRDLDSRVVERVVLHSHASPSFVDADTSSVGVGRPAAGAVVGVPAAESADGLYARHTRLVRKRQQLNEAIEVLSAGIPIPKSPQAPTRGEGTPGVRGSVSSAPQAATGSSGVWWPVNTAAGHLPGGDR